MHTNSYTGPRLWAEAPYLNMPTGKIVTGWNEQQPNEKGMSSTLQNTSAIHPTLLANVEGKQVRLMIDTGASSSYICTDVITKLGLQPARKERRCIEQMYGSMTKVVEVYNVTVISTIGNEFKVDLECINAEKPILTHLPNPNVEQVKRKQPRLRRLNISEEKSTGDTLPVHIMLGVADFQCIKSSEPPILGNQPEKDPGAEFTMLGWTLYGGVRTSDQSDKQFLLNTGQEEFERLCSGNVLGVTDPVDMSSFEHEELKKQLIQNQDGFYETRLPWKVGHVPLPENKNQSTARLYSVTRKLERIGKLKEYDDVMQDHLGKGVIEPVPVQPTREIVHYVPTNSNPSDLGTRGAAPDKLVDLWYKGPDWLQKHDQWPEQPEINETTDVTQELAMKRTLAKQGVERDLEMINNMLAKFTYRRLLRVTAYILRFVRMRETRNYMVH